MDTAPASMPERLTCTCCGSGVRDTPDENASHGESPYPHDNGFGLCVECGGDKSAGAGKPARDLTDAEVKKRLGWQGTIFYEARIAVVRERLNDANRAKFDAMTYGKKVVVVAGLVEKGVLI